MNWIRNLFQSRHSKMLKRAYDERQSLRDALQAAEQRGDTRAIGKLRMRLQDQTTYCLSLAFR